MAVTQSLFADSTLVMQICTTTYSATYTNYDHDTDKHQILEQKNDSDQAIYIPDKQNIIKGLFK